MTSSRSSPSCSLDELLDLGDTLLGLLDPRAGRRADVDLERAGVDFGEELAAQLRPEPTTTATSRPTAPPTTSTRARMTSSSSRT